MAHVDAAISEMFRAVHMQLLGNACRLEKLLMAALVLEMRATGTMCSRLQKRKLPRRTLSGTASREALAGMSV
jgi:hypothetical protein